MERLPLLRSLRRISFAVLLALPGMGLAFIAKPLKLGEGTLLLGVLLAFAVPILWLVNGRVPVSTKSLPIDSSDFPNGGVPSQDMR